MHDREPSELIFVAGFLGAGKTTLVNRLLTLIDERPIGLIVNEFGEHGVDGALVTPGYEPVELNGGQIFCACLSPKLLESLADMHRRELPIVVVEASGLARPAVLTSLLDQLEHLLPGAYRFRGMMTVVDAARIEKLAAMAPVVDEQIRHANTVLVNKVDLVDEASVARIEARIRDLNPDAAIGRTIRCEITAEAIPSVGAVHAIGQDPDDWPRGRPQPFSLLVEVGDPEEAQERCRRSASLAMRIKGFVLSRTGPLVVDAVGDQVRVEPAKPERARPCITVIPVSSEAAEELRSIWSGHLSRA
ncbi:MAG: CobW family GTP-binding protein [Spirochaetota bacterium]